MPVEIKCDANHFQIPESDLIKKLQREAVSCEEAVSEVMKSDGYSAYIESLEVPEGSVLGVRGPFRQIKNHFS